MGEEWEGDGPDSTRGQELDVSGSPNPLATDMVSTHTHAQTSNSRGQPRVQLTVSLCAPRAESWHQNPGRESPSSKWGRSQDMQASIVSGSRPCSTDRQRYALFLLSAPSSWGVVRQSAAPPHVQLPDIPYDTLSHWASRCINTRISTRHCSARFCRGGSDCDGWRGQPLPRRPRWKARPKTITRELWRDVDRFSAQCHGTPSHL